MRVKKKRKFQREGGSSQTQMDGGLKRKNLPWGGGGKDIFWNYTMLFSPHPVKFEI